MFLFNCFRSWGKRGLRRAEGWMPPARNETATVLGTHRRAVALAPPCAAQGRARFQGSCVCLFVVCLLFAYCLFVLLFPSRAGRQSSEAEPIGTAMLPCFRHASVTLPSRFRYVSVVRLPVAPARGKCKGSLHQRAIIKETSVGAR